MENQQFAPQEPTLEQRERKYLHEFQLLSVKFAKKLSDLTDYEVQLWTIWSGGEMIWPLSDGLIDPLDQEANLDYAREEIRVMEWQWNKQTLIDINTWPGDKESGAIFLDSKIVFTNNDQDIYDVKTCPDLAERVDSYRHIRIQRCQEEEGYDNDHPVHKHCVQVKKEYDRLVDL